MKTLLISVGGSPDPVITVLKEKKPAKVIFFCSQDSRSEVESEILPHIGYFPQDGFVVTPNHEDVGACTFELMEKVPEEMRKLGEAGVWPALCGYTGGTKAMSAAVVWAASRYPCELIYVGGENRTKDGLGTVESGSEKMVCMENPWNQVAWHETRLARELFNRGQYANAAHLIRSTLEKIGNPEVRRVQEWMRDLFDAFHAWDIFDFKGAGRLHGVARNAPWIRAQPALGLSGFCGEVEACLDRLKCIPAGEASREMALDLLANARRRAELEGKYEDAVARCYSATEKLAKVQLKEAYSIDNSAVPLTQIPETLQGEFSRYDDGGGVLKFGLKASFKLLAELGDPMGQAYMSREKENGGILGSRNESILGHGFKPSKKEDFDAFFELALHIAQIKECDLVQFPSFA